MGNRRRRKGVGVVDFLVMVFRVFLRKMVVFLPSLLRSPSLLPFFRGAIPLGIFSSLLYSPISWILHRAPLFAFFSPPWIFSFFVSPWYPLLPLESVKDNLGRPERVYYPLCIHVYIHLSVIYFFFYCFTSSSARMSRDSCLKPV